MPPKVSVIMPVYNREAYVSESIASILDQTFKDFEFIIVDDGSTDRSNEIIQEYAQQDSRIQLISLDKNVGIARGTNHALERVSGQYIALMDSDDISMVSRLKCQVDYLDAHPEVGVLGSRMQVVDQNKAPLFIFDVPQQHSLIVWNLFFGRTFGNPSVMMRADNQILETGYSHAFVPSHDIDLWAKMAGQVRFANLSDILVSYRTHENSISIQKVEQKTAGLKSILNRTLRELWGDDASEQTVARFIKIRSGKPQFTKDEYKQVKTDLHRLAKSMLAKGWILPEENNLVDTDIKRLLVLSKPQSKGFLNRLRNKFTR